MTNVDWKCPACGYLNQPFDASCAKCGSDSNSDSDGPKSSPWPRRRGWGRKISGCLILVLLVVAANWLWRIDSVRTQVLAQLPPQTEGAKKKQEVNAMKAFRKSPEGRKRQQELDAQSKEITRLIGVLQGATDPEITAEAMSQLAQAVHTYTVNYPEQHGLHDEMPEPIARAVDYSFGFIAANPQSPFSPYSLNTICSTVLAWKLEDLRRYERQLLQLLGQNVPAWTDPGYSGGNIEMYRQLDEEQETNRKLRAQGEDMHAVECELLEYGLYPRRFMRLETVDYEGDNANQISEDLDVAHAKELIPKLRLAAGKSQSSAGTELADRLEQQLHEIEIKAAVRSQK